MCDLDRKTLSSLTGAHVTRGPSVVAVNFSSSGIVIDWLNGIPGVGVWNQPIWIRRPSVAGRSLNVCRA